jgi:hypothetical protein
MATEKDDRGDVKLIHDYFRQVSMSNTATPYQLGLHDPLKIMV